MKVTECLRHYDAGTLETLETGQLLLIQMFLAEKVQFLRQVAKQQNVAIQVYADIRKYEAVFEKIKEVMKPRCAKFHKWSDVDWQPREWQFSRNTEFWLLPKFI